MPYPERRRPPSSFRAGQRQPYTNPASHIESRAIAKDIDDEGHSRQTPNVKLNETRMNIGATIALSQFSTGGYFQHDKDGRCLIPDDVSPPPASGPVKGNLDDDNVFGTGRQHLSNNNGDSDLSIHWTSISITECGAHTPCCRTYTFEPGNYENFDIVASHLDPTSGYPARLKLLLQVLQSQLSTAS
jgi:hypothetical protein